MARQVWRMMRQGCQRGEEEVRHQAHCLVSSSLSYLYRQSHIADCRRFTTARTLVPSKSRAERRHTVASRKKNEAWDQTIPIASGFRSTSTIMANMLRSLNSKYIYGKAVSFPSPSPDNTMASPLCDLRACCAAGETFVCLRHGHSPIGSRIPNLTFALNSSPWCTSWSS